MRAFALATVLMLGGLLFYATPDFPSWGDPQSPASLHVSPYFIEHAMADTHAPNIVTAVLAQDRRVLLFGAPGVGKSTLVSMLAAELAQQGRSCWCLGADPGSPLLGLPGAVSLGHWAGEWQVTAASALCTLDAGRFRLPLVTAVHQLMQQPPQGTLLIDGKFQVETSLRIIKFKSDDEFEVIATQRLLDGKEQPDIVGTYTRIQ